jgi:aminodeoxyfutalosine synthase
MISDKFIIKIKDKVLSGERLTADDAAELYKNNNVLEIGMIADYVRKKKHAKKAFYVYNQHINYTNLCSNMCLFCAYAKPLNHSEAFTYSIEDIRKKLNERIKEPIIEIHIVGGLNKELDLNYYLEMLKAVKEIRPNATIKAFTAVEIDYLSKISNLSINETINKLKKSGLSMMPGGGAEILNDRVRKKLFPNKIPAEKWLEIQKAVHEAGIRTNATMLYGHIETIEERAEHLIKLRNLQDETKGFLSFIPLAFHSENTKLSHLPKTSAFDDLKTIAISRLVLDNFDHIKAYWVMIGEKMAQLALSFGADDLDGTIINEKIAHMAGAKTPKSLYIEEMENLILKAGYTPVMRDAFYNEINK